MPDLVKWTEDGPAIHIQQAIDSGAAWTLEGSVGRAAMAAIEDGRAVLGLRAHRDYWGNRVPARWEVQQGTLGSQRFAHDQQGHERPYARCRVGTCGLKRRPVKED